jgi:hypothetical protein
VIRIPPRLTAAAAAAITLGSTAFGIGVVPAASAHTATRPAVRAIAAKSCSAGYTRGVINGEVKCLRAGEFCTHSANKQYHRYGFNCTRYYRNVHEYRLTYRD